MMIFNYSMMRTYIRDDTQRERRGHHAAFAEPIEGTQQATGPATYGSIESRASLSSVLSSIVLCHRFDSQRACACHA